MFETSLPREKAANSHAIQKVMVKGMTDSVERVAQKSGLPPGTLVHVGEKPGHRVTISVSTYNGSSFNERVVDSLEQIPPATGTEKVSWINITGLHDVEKVREIGEFFSIHPLVLEDILNPNQRPKLEDFDNYLYIVLKRLAFDKDAIHAEPEQISIVVFEQFVITFRQSPDDLFEHIKRSLESGRSRVRGQGTDYLAYLLLDSIVDQYFGFLDGLDELTETLENELLDNPTPDTLAEIQRLNRVMIFARRAVSPTRELLASLLRGGSELIHDSTIVYLRDVYDHAVRIIESIETYRDLTAGMLDIYLSSLSNRMNEIMKVLTAFASIFIPLAFITGIYGMNFEYMPELKWRWGYPAVWLVFIALAASLLWYFKKKKWF